MLDALCRTAWKVQEGEWYIFREESDEFLKYVISKEDRDGGNREDVMDFIEMAKSEVRVRKINTDA